MNKSRWIVKAEYATREELEKMYKEHGTEDFQSVEIAVVREDNKLGQMSHGWDGLDKITLFDGYSENYNEEDIKWCEEVAKTICEALNQEGL